MVRSSVPISASAIGAPWSTAPCGSLLLASSSTTAGEGSHRSLAATWKPTAKEITVKFSTFCAKCAAGGLSKELQDQLTRDRARFQKIVDQIVEANELMDNSVKRIQAREIPKAKPEPIDFKQLKHVLGLDKYPKIEDDLKGALKLEGSARAKALDAIEKKFNFKFKSDQRAKLMDAKKQ